MPFRDEMSERICKARTVTEGNVHIALPEKEGGSPCIISPK